MKLVARPKSSEFEVAPNETDVFYSQTVYCWGSLLGTKKLATVVVVRPF